MAGPGDDLPVVPEIEGPTRPDRITIWPVAETRFGIDVSYRGKKGYARAETVERHLRAEGISVTFMQEADGAWAVRFGPVDRDAMLAVLNSVVW